MILNHFEVFEKGRRKPQIDELFNKNILIEPLLNNGLLDDTCNNYGEFSGVGAGTKSTINYDSEKNGLVID